MVKSKILMLIKKVKTDMIDTDMDMNAKSCDRADRAPFATCEDQSARADDDRAEQETLRHLSGLDRAAAIPLVTGRGCK
jgi:hypothetical protein